MTLPIQTLIKVRLTYKLLLLSALTACGAPGSDSVFVMKTPKVPAVDSAATKALAQAAAPRIVSKQYRGWYRRINDTSQFQPCGAKYPLDVRGTPVGVAMLRERYRYSAPWLGAKMFGVLQGAIVTDTTVARGVQGDSATVVVPRTRFFITGADSMRAVRSTDCGEARAP